MTNVTDPVPTQPPSGDSLRVLAREELNEVSGGSDIKELLASYKAALVIQQACAPYRRLCVGTAQ